MNMPPTKQTITLASTPQQRPVYAFALQSPPPSQHLKKILENYPEGSQILKEALQNADDAGATEFSILLDERYQRDTGAPDRFVGPSLIFYNDGVFNPDDWRGMQNMFESRKSQNCGKIGKFGMGSRSYFHLTDILTIVSGDSMAYLDPDWILTKKGGEFSQLPLVTNVTATENQDIFIDSLVSLLKNTFEFDGSSEHYPGTLFRLPLRMGRWAKISSFAPYEYTVAKTWNLLNKFKKEAVHCLFFLQSVQIVTIWRWPEAEEEPIRMYSCCIKPDPFIAKPSFNTSKTNWDKRGLIRNYLQSKHSSGSSLEEALTQPDSGSLPEVDDIVVMIEHERLNETHQDDFYQIHTTKSRWLLNAHLVPYSELLPYLKFTKVPPSIGIAALISPPISSTTTHPSTQSFEEVESKSNQWTEEEFLSMKLNWTFEKDSIERMKTSPGSAFCYLPLSDVQTGLPLHVHGTFILTDNRRSLWMATDDTDGQAQKWSEWNLILLRVALPEMYIKVLSKFNLLTLDCYKDLYKQLHQANLTDDDVEHAVQRLEDNYYDLWPDPQKVSPKLQPFLKQFVEQLKDHKLFLKQPNFYPTDINSIYTDFISSRVNINYQDAKNRKQFSNSLGSYSINECHVLKLTQQEELIFNSYLNALMEAIKQCQTLGRAVVYLPHHIFSLFTSEEVYTSQKSNESIIHQNSFDTQDSDKFSDSNKRTNRTRKLCKRSAMIDSASVLKTSYLLEIHYRILIPSWKVLSSAELKKIPHFSTLMLCLCKILGRSPDKYIYKFKDSCMNLPFIPTRIPGIDVDENENLILKAPVDCFDPSLSGFKVGQLSQPGVYFRSPDVLRVLRAWGLKQRLGWAEIAQEAVSRVCVVGDCQPSAQFAASIPQHFYSATKTKL